MDSPTLFDRWVARSRPLWITLVISLLLLGFPILCAALDGVLVDSIQNGRWRALLIPVLVIIYILIVSPMMERMGKNVIRSIRPLAPVEDAEFDMLIQNAANIPKRNEAIVLGIGAILGILSAQVSGMDPDLVWLRIYWYLGNTVMFGLLLWTIYLSIVSTRVNTAIHRMPLQFDVLDIAPFEVVGRQSVLLALVFVGGITLSLVLSFQPGNLAQVEFWLVYLLFIGIILLIFFLNMLPTHRLLSNEKQNRLKSIQEIINKSCLELQQRIEQQKNSGNLPVEIQAFGFYEQRIMAARTWPYNTDMLRTLFFSVLVPIGTLLVRVGFEILYP